MLYAADRRAECAKVRGRSPQTKGANMESRIDQATARHNSGYNCAQAVACAYCDLVNVDERTMFRITEGMGLGMGAMNCTCGALSGAVAVAGALNSDGALDAPKTKAQTYKLSRRLTDRFNELAGATRCRDLKGIDTGGMLMSCPDCVRAGAKVVEEILFPEEG